jgi:arylsulfatase A-like enzyme
MRLVSDGKIRDYEPWLIGALAGLVDATAMGGFVPHAIPFSMTSYALGGAVLFGVARAILGLPLGHPRAKRIALGLETALFVLLFFGYKVVTASSGFFAGGSGAKVGILLGAMAALVAGWLVGRSWREHRAPVVLRALLAVALLAWPVLTLVELARGPGESGRGLILVSMDAARGDRVSALGYGRPTTPNLDRLVESGTAFSRAIVQTPASGPSHASMLTGLPPLAHQVLHNADVLDPAVLTVAERLKATGFATAAFADNFYIDSRYGFDQGFDTFVNEFRASAVDTWSAHHLLRTTVAYHLWYRLSREPGQKNTDSLDGAIQWLRVRPRGDFFVFLHLMDPHAPYDAPPSIRDRFYTPAGERVRDTVELRARLDRASDAEIAALKDLYDASIALADHKLGRLLGEMEALGLLENSLVVVTADHGELLDEIGPVFDHGLPNHGNLHVPLVLGGGLAQGELVDRTVSMTSWVRHAFARLGLDYEPQFPVGDGDGLVFGLTGVGASDSSYAVDGQLKVVIGEGGTTRWYDLAADPFELGDRRVADLEEGPLRERVVAMELGLLDWLEATAAAGIVSGRRTDENFDAATREQLKALGYIE